MSHLGLSDKISKLRATAAALYDVNKANGMPPEKIAEHLVPLTYLLDTVINDAVKSNVGETALAIKCMENKIHAYEMDIKFLQQKILDTRDYIDHINAIVLKRMAEEETDNLHGDGFMLTRSVKDGKEKVNVK